MVWLYFDWGTIENQHKIQRKLTVNRSLIFLEPMFPKQNASQPELRPQFPLVYFNSQFPLAHSIFGSQTNICSENSLVIVFLSIFVLMGGLRKRLILKTGDFL